MLSGNLDRENVRTRVKDYVAEYNRMFPTKYAKFGDRPLVSLDEVLFENGLTTRGDTPGGFGISKPKAGSGSV
jgi:hypothetical protein